MAIECREESFCRYRLADLVDIDTFAALAKVQPRTIHSYRHARKTKYAVPEPVAVVGTTPVWTRRQVFDWIDTRPGQGARMDLFV